MEKRKIKEIGFLLGLLLLLAMVIRIINNEDTIIDFKASILAIAGSALGVITSIFIKKFQNRLRKKPIYISYNINDKEFVNKLTEKLTEKGFSVLKETSIISPGDQMNNKIIETIKDAKVFLFVVSSNIYKSKFLKEEVLIAKHKGIKIIPIIKDDVELPSYLNNYKIADFRGDFEIAINNLTNTI
ncbi:toll/interleukin-1 receptor domain-containing protein [uncultured Flavobacterium sp.]|uniref:toll/interleukin-1 receptor domain-containing protein n=1 Tax=uncultured Flavobacterium sp. TaxID=165435 RepID=UPI002596C680|nr:toll/interleukin-1 receptor domain-containing protein [uncultured Flavobacterium sp.]